MDVSAGSSLHGFASHDHHALSSFLYAVALAQTCQNQLSISVNLVLRGVWMQMCIADGPSLPLDEHLHRLSQLSLLCVVYLLSLGWISILCKFTSSTVFTCLCSSGFASSSPCFSMCLSDGMLCSAICTLDSTSLLWCTYELFQLQTCDTYAAQAAIASCF